jgi:uncharacterized membrane protein YhaH (DUF805 family)
MRLRLNDLWRWDGAIERDAYCMWGVLLFALKFNLDRVLGAVFFHKSWAAFDWDQVRLYLWQVAPERADRAYFLTLLAAALPFLWAGVVLTLRRLRSLGWKPWWVLLFFVPVLKLIFFALLSLLPSRVTPGAYDDCSTPRPTLIGAFIPRSAFGSAAVAVFISIGAAVSMLWFGVTVLGNYGWSIFVGLPFAMGLLSVLIHSCHERRDVLGCLALANGTVLLAGVGLLLFAMEGAICLLMAAPLAFTLGSVGGLVGYMIQETFRSRDDSPRLLCLAILAVPTTMAMEHTIPPPAPLFEVRSSVIVSAPPEKVWQNVVSFSELPPPTEAIFKLGVAYPVHAEIHGHGVGAIRHCNFSTGPFVEPIEVWDEPRLLQFSVTRNPPPMQEWTPYQEIHPPHLDGYLESRAGQFRLLKLDDGRTLLEGTTWYYHHLWPAGYWKLWSDFIIHRIHLRVLNHVKNLAERKKS